MKSYVFIHVCLSLFIADWNHSQLSGFVNQLLSYFTSSFIIVHGYLTLWSIHTGVGSGYEVLILSKPMSESPKISIWLRTHDRVRPTLINTFIINVRGSLKFLRVDFVRLVCGELSQKLWSRGLKVESRRVQIWKFKTKPSLAKWYILPVISWNEKFFVRLWLIDLTHISFI